MAARLNLPQRHRGHGEIKVGDIYKLQLPSMMSCFVLGVDLCARYPNINKKSRHFRNGIHI